MEKRITIRDIARVTGVSKATVSRVMHSPNIVATETRAAVREAMERHHYVYNAVAGDLSRSRTSVIAAIIPSIRLSLFAATTQAVQETAAERGYSVLIGNANYDPAWEVRLLQLFQQRRIAGVILTGLSRAVRDFLPTLRENGIPCVITWEMVEDPDLSCVGFDNHRAAFTATDYLLTLGHRRVGLIVGPFSRVERVHLRLSGYRAALSARGIPFDPALVIEKDYSLLNGKEAMLRMLERPERPTACFAASDVLAMGALSALWERGWHVPRDFSLVGFDDTDFAAYTQPPLTTVRVPAYEMGQLALKTLLDLVEERETATQHYCLDTNLIIRDSARERQEQRHGKERRGGPF